MGSFGIWARDPISKNLDLPIAGQTWFEAHQDFNPQKAKQRFAQNGADVYVGPTQTVLDGGTQHL